MAFEQILRELRANKQRTREQLGSLRSEMRLEMSLEKSRQKDISLQSALKFQSFESKVECEVGNSDANLGKMRYDILASVTGFFFASVAAFLGYLRLIG